MNFAQQASAISAIILVTAYLFGVTFGVLGGVTFGSVRENLRMSLLEQAPDPVSAGARVILCLVTRDDDGYLRRLPPAARRKARGSRGDDPSGSPGQGVNR